LLIAMIGVQLSDYSTQIFHAGRLDRGGRPGGRRLDRRCGKHQASGSRTSHPAAQDVLASVKEVAGAVTASTLTTVTVFARWRSCPGWSASSFRLCDHQSPSHLGASLLVSMTIVPVLAYWFLRGGARRRQLAATAAEKPGATEASETHTAEETKVTRLQRGYLPILRFGLTRPFITLGIALLVFVGTLGSATLLKTDFIGSVTDQTTLAIQQKLPAGTRLSTTSAAATQVENLLRGDPQVKSYLVTIGGSLVPGTSRNTNTAEFTVLLAEDAKADTVRPQLEQQVAELDESAGEITVTTTNNQSTTNDLTVTVKSENTASLQIGAKEVERELDTVPGLTNIRTNLEEQRKLLKVTLDKKKAASLGFTQGDVGQAISNALRGTQVGSITLAGEQRDIFVRSQAADEPTPADIGNLELPVSPAATDQCAEEGLRQADRQAEGVYQGATAAPRRCDLRSE
jgi:HAE1 family hydrophobic/amphiphilic exporter-1